VSRCSLSEQGFQRRTSGLRWRQRSMSAPRSRNSGHLDGRGASPFGGSADHRPGVSSTSAIPQPTGPLHRGFGALPSHRSPDRLRSGSLDVLVGVTRGGMRAGERLGRGRNREFMTVRVNGSGSRRPSSLARCRGSDFHLGPSRHDGALWLGLPGQDPMNRDGRSGAAGWLWARGAQQRRRRTATP
jgi:hypothetical protein